MNFLKNITDKEVAMTNSHSLIWLFAFMAGVTIIDNWFEIGIFLKFLFKRKK